MTPPGHLPPHVRLAMVLAELAAQFAPSVSTVAARRDDVRGNKYPARFEVAAPGLGKVRITVEPAP